jgi:hypothetical protein
MTAIAEELDAKLNPLDAKAASSLEKSVRDALELVEAQNEVERLPRQRQKFKASSVLQVMSSGPTTPSASHHFRLNRPLPLAYE